MATPQFLVMEIWERETIPRSAAELVASDGEELVHVTAVEAANV